MKYALQDLRAGQGKLTLCDCKERAELSGVEWAEEMKGLHDDLW